MDGLKQRIIGALVLVSLAVIFVPMIFDEPHSERVSSPIPIPEEPPFPEVDVSTDAMPEPPRYETGGSEQPVPDLTAEAPETSAAPAYRILESGDEPAAQVSAPTDEPAAPTSGEPSMPVTPAASEPAAAAPATPAEAPETEEYRRSLAGAWVVQLGSFGNPDNARRLRDEVRAKGYGSHLQQVTRGDTTLTRVFSGPFATRNEAEAAKKALDDAFKLNSLVTEGEK